MDPIDNKWQVIQKMMDNKLVNNSIQLRILIIKLCRVTNVFLN